MIPNDAKKVFSGVIFDVYQWEQELYDGTTATFEKLDRPDTVEMIAGTKGGRVLLLEQKQSHIDEMFLSLPGGRVDPGEGPKQAIERELMEETGFEASDIELHKTWDPSDKINQTVHVFIGRGCEQVAEQNLGPGEDIDVKLVSLRKFLEGMTSEISRHYGMKGEFTEALYNEETFEWWHQKLFEADKLDL
jgi:8-oxo-dGTP pyrophosphatase MutT (NUDIX family)